MKLFGRHFGALLKLPQYAGEGVSCARTFRKPAIVLRAYLTRQIPPDGLVVLRSGLKLYLSTDPLDIVSVFVVFVWRDYGTIARGSTVLDLGANIGVFSVYAANSGAAVVHSYEPSAESFGLLGRNIRANGIGDRVTAFRVAAGSGAPRTVKFPRRSSVFNSIQVGLAEESEYDEVPLENSQTIVSKIGRVDLAKLDCEGEEERILLDAEDTTLAHLSDMPPEFHHGRGSVLLDGLKKRGFALTRRCQVDELGGLAWFRREGAA